MPAMTLPGSTWEALRWWLLEERVVRVVVGLRRPHPRIAFSLKTGIRAKRAGLLVARGWHGDNGAVAKNEKVLAIN